MTDPWTVRKVNNPENNIDNIINQEESITQIEAGNSLEFEDNFTFHSIGNNLNSNQNLHLPDSQEYLQSLEKKLTKLKKDPKILKQLTEKREECLRNLLNDNSFTDKDETLQLDAPISSESAVQEIYRHIQPVQPLSVGEVVHIVKYDQLENREEDTVDNSVEEKNTDVDADENI